MLEGSRGAGGGSIPGGLWQSTELCGRRGATGSWRVGDDRVVVYAPFPTLQREEG